MSIDNFIPEIWASSTLERLNKTYVMAMLCTRQYEPDILKMGASIKVNTFARPVIGDYTKNGSASARQKLDGSQQTISIDQAKDFNFDIDDIDAMQQTPKIMSEAMGEAGDGLADVMDQFLLGLHVGVHADNTIGSDGSPVVPTAANIYNYFTEAGMKLTESNVPMAGRWAVIPPWMYKLLQDSDQFTRATALDDGVIRTGHIGAVAGFEVYVSNNVDNTSGTLYKVMFGYRRAIALCEQLQKVRAYQPDDSHCDAVKGLHVYGGKLIQDHGIVVMTANKA